MTESYEGPRSEGNPKLREIRREIGEAIDEKPVLPEDVMFIRGKLWGIRVAIRARATDSPFYTQSLSELRERLEEIRDSGNNLEEKVQGLEI